MKNDASKMLCMHRHTEIPDEAETNEQRRKERRKVTQKCFFEEEWIQRSMDMQQARERRKKSNNNNKINYMTTERTEPRKPWKALTIFLINWKLLNETTTRPIAQQINNSRNNDQQNRNVRNAHKQSKWSERNDWKTERQNAYNKIHKIIDGGPVFSIIGIDIISICCVPWLLELALPFSAQPMCWFYFSLFCPLARWCIFFEIFYPKKNKKQHPNGFTSY